MNIPLHVEAAGDGPPVVLLHGWALHSGIWGGLPASLARRHRVHAVDLPGHGLSPPVAPFTAAAIVTLLERTFAGERDPLTVVGWSLGGQLALAWARARPERIASLVLVATTPRFVDGEGWDCAMARATLEGFAADLEADWRATVLRFLTLQMRGSEHGHAALALMRRELFARGEPARAALRETLALLATTDLRALVAEVAQPALVVAGTRDALVPAAACRWLAAALPNGRFTAIDGAAHVPFLSHPDAFGRALSAFLDER
jgi:pimeloyl-[acyl-carrier protein] methyl ester esterase